MASGVVTRGVIVDGAGIVAQAGSSDLVLIDVVESNLVVDVIRAALPVY